MGRSRARILGAEFFLKLGRSCCEATAYIVSAICKVSARGLAVGKSSPARNLHVIIECGSDSVTEKAAFDRHGGRLLRGRAQGHVAIVDDGAMGSIKAAPPPARQKNFRPSVQVAPPVLRFGMSLIAADEARGDAEAATGGYEQHGEVTASAAADGERVRWTMGCSFDPDVSVEAGKQRAIQGFKE